MRILVADDDSLVRRLVGLTLVRDGHQVVTAESGVEALGHLNSDAPPHLALLDWIMPGLDGPSLCRRVRARDGAYVYLLLLTSRSAKEDVVYGLESGADDFMSKPVYPGELLARVNVGARTVQLQPEHQRRISELRPTLPDLSRLRGILPICTHCKRIRNERQAWEQIECFIATHSEAKFSHSLCSDCLERHYPA